MKPILLAVAALAYAGIGCPLAGSFRFRDTPEPVRYPWFPPVVLVLLIPGIGVTLALRLLPE